VTETNFGDQLKQFSINYYSQLRTLLGVCHTKPNGSSVFAVVNPSVVSSRHDTQYEHHNQVNQLQSNYEFQNKQIHYTPPQNQEKPTEETTREQHKDMPNCFIYGKLKEFWKQKQEEKERSDVCVQWILSLA